MSDKTKVEIRKPPARPSDGQEAVTFERLDEYPYKSVAMASTRANLTGLWRYWRPYYQTKRAPCDAHCPVGNRVVDYIQTMLEGDWTEAATILRSENPLPAVTGRLCHRPCEANCNRLQYDHRTSIHDVERVLAEVGYRPLAFPEMEEPRKAAVIGSGPAQLGFAHFMASLNQEVTIFDAREGLGGELRFGSRARRLPDGLLDAEVARIIDRGVDVVKQAVKPEDLLNDYDVVFGGEPDSDTIALHLSNGEVLQRDWDSGLTGWFADDGSLRSGKVKKSPLVSEAIGFGKWAALLVDAGWRGLKPEETLGQIAVGGTNRIVSAGKYSIILADGEFTRSEEIVTYDKLNLDMLEPQPDVTPEMVEQGEALIEPQFAEAGDAELVLREAARCFSCGRCNDCANCWVFCPDGVVLREDGVYDIDYDYCKGCRICAAVCPRYVISVIEEEEWNG